MSVTNISFGGVFFLNYGDELLYSILISLSAIGIGGCLVIPSSMQADTASLDRINSGIDREGVLVSFWSLSKKISAALAVGLAFPLLDWFNFRPESVQSEQVIQLFKILYAGVPQEYE